MRNIQLALFAFAGGLTLSGIVANLYRLVAKKPKSRSATWVHYAVMALAGPSVLVENSTRSFRQKDCGRAAYGFAVAIAAYWAFILGLIVIDLSISI